MNVLTSAIKPMYLRYLAAALGSSMITCVYIIVDAAVVGHYLGPVGTATMSVVMPMWNIIYSLGLLTGIGGAVLYGVERGRGNKREADCFFTAALWMNAIFAIAVWAAFLFFDAEILTLFGADAQLLPLAREYIGPIKVVIPVFMFSQFLAAFLRNDDDPVRVTVAVLCGGVFNIVGDLLLVFVFDMGIFGAGLATALGGVISVSISLSHFFSKKNGLRPVQVRGALRRVGMIAGNGFGAFIMDITMGFISVMMNRQIMALFGAEHLAAYGVVAQMTIFVQSTAYGAGQSAQPLMSANLGASQRRRVRETMACASAVAVLFGVLWCGSMALAPNAFLNLLMEPTAQVAAIAPGIIRTYCVGFLFAPLSVVCMYFFQSLLKARSSFITAIARGVILSGLFIHLLPALFGSNALWFAMPLTELLIAASAVYFTRKYAGELR